MQELEKRMYGWVNYQLSNTNHAGIQFGHAVVEYANDYFNTEEYQSWARNYKTFIILNGGITNDNIVEYGMLSIIKKLIELDVKYASFREPDLNDAITGICLIVDERVYNKEKYPIKVNETFSFPPRYKVDEDDLIAVFGDFETGKRMYELRNFLSNFRLL